MAKSIITGTVGGCQFGPFTPIIRRARRGAVFTERIAFEDVYRPGINTNRVVELNSQRDDVTRDCRVPHTQLIPSGASAR